MKKPSFLILLTFLNFSLFSQVQDRKIELSTKDKILGLSRLWEGVRNNFVYYDQLKFDWDSLYSASIPTILDTKDAYTYIKELERIVATVKDGHTFITHDISPAWEERICPAPFTTKFVNGKVLVDKVWSSDLIRKGVVRGVEVVTIENMNVIEYGEEILGQYIPSSTRQWLDYKVFNNFELTKAKWTIPVKIEFFDGKKSFILNIERNVRWDIQEKERSLGKSDESDYSTLKYETISNNIGVLTIRDFMNDNFKPTFDSIYNEILQSNGLVIDLRNNGGGRSDDADYILRHLSKKPIKTCPWSSRMYIPAHASWNYAQEWYTYASEFLTPAEKIYDKPIIVLINAGTFSSAEDFCVKFRGMKRGKLIGSPSGGSTGNGVQISLIDGIVDANICSKKDLAPDGTAYVGVGVIPDIDIKETMESFLEKKDIVLQKAISMLLVSNN